MNAQHWLRGSSYAFAWLGLLPPWCGAFPEPTEGMGGNSNAGASSHAGAVGTGGNVATAGAGGGAGSAGAGGDTGTGGAPGEFAPDPIVGCTALPWPEAASFEVLDGAPARVTNVSWNGDVVIGASSAGNPTGGATIWTPTQIVLPTSAGLSSQLVEVTNCVGDVFAGADAAEDSALSVGRVFWQTTTTAPALLPAPAGSGSLTSYRVTAFTADGSRLLGYAHNGIGNFPLAAVWDTAGDVTTPLGNYPHLPVVMSPDGSHIAGRTDCGGGLSCAGVQLFDWSAADGEVDFGPANALLATYVAPVISRDRTTAAGTPQDLYPNPTFSSVVWFRRGGPTIEIPCFGGGPCQPVAMSSHGSVLLLNDHSVWTSDGRHRTFPQFLGDASVELPQGTDPNQITPIAISDDARVIAGYFSGELGDHPFKLTLSPRAYR